MIFSGNHFVYNGINSQRYNLRILHLDTQPITQASGTPEYNKIFYNNEKRNSIIGMNWSESPISTEIEFITEKPLKKQDKREIEKWLFNNSQFQKLYIDIREDEEIEIINGEKKQCYIECVFYEPTVIEYYGGIVGFKAKMDMSCPFAFQDEIKIEFGNENLMTINIDTDLNEPVYPKIIIETNSDTSDSGITLNNNVGVSWKYQYNYGLSTPKLDKTAIYNQLQISSIEANSTLTIEPNTSQVILTKLNGDKFSWFNNIVDSKFLKLLQGENKLEWKNGQSKIKSITFIYQQMRYIR